MTDQQPIGDWWLTDCSASLRKKLSCHPDIISPLIPKLQDFGNFELLLMNIGPVKQKNSLRKIVIIFLSISLNICFGCSKEPSHREGSFEYPQHMFLLRNKKNNFQLHTLIWGSA